MPAPTFTPPLNATEETILRHYHLPDGVWGYLDWVTGLVRLNLTGEEYANGTRTEEFELTLNHELFHAFQICTTGYLYRLCTELLREIVRIIIAVSPEVDIFEVIERPPAGTARINELLHAMDAANPDGITVRDLVEGYAFYGHAALHDPALKAAAFSRRLDDAPAEEYRRAFRYCEAQLGRRAFGIFPLLCYLSLLFRDPPDVFCRLHGLLPRGCWPARPRLFRQVIGLLDQIPAEYLGIPTQDEQLYDLPNPFYDWSRRKIKEAIGPSLVHYAGQPGRIPNALQQSLLRPVILNDFHRIEPNTFATDSPHSANSILILAVASFQILSRHHAGPRMLRLQPSV